MIVPRETGGFRGLSEADALRSGAVSLGVGLTDDQADRLLAYLNEIRKWNQRVNLVGTKGGPEEVILHLLDSLASAPEIPAGPFRVLDFGSGAGLPGIALKIVRPDVMLTLADARSKKAAFLAHAIRTLGLKEAKAVAARLGRDDRVVSKGAFDLVVVRAVGALKEILPVARRYIADDGRILAYKGPGADKEWEEAAGASSDLILSGRKDYTLPFLEHRRTLLWFGKDRQASEN